MINRWWVAFGWLIVGVMALMNTACTGLSNASNRELASGWMGCSPQEVGVNGESGHGIETFVAYCRGRTFHCSRGGGGIFHCSLDYQPAQSMQPRPQPMPPRPQPGPQPMAVQPPPPPR